EQGTVRLSVVAASGGWSPDHQVLSRTASVIAFEVSDTGIGIPPEKQRIIFEAFQQADAGTSRKYGGNGLGLSISPQPAGLISREMAGLLGGEIQLRNVVGPGSTFTLYLPQAYVGPSTGVNVTDKKSSQALTPLKLTAASSAERAHEKVPDDREMLFPDDVIL